MKAMKRTCKECRMAVYDYLDQTLTAKARRDVERHLAACVACRAFYKTERARSHAWPVLLAAAARKVPPPEGLVNRLASWIDLARQPGFGYHAALFGHARLGAGLGIAAALALLFGGVLWALVNRETAAPASAAASAEIAAAVAETEVVAAAPGIPAATAEEPVLPASLGVAGTSAAQLIIVASSGAAETAAKTQGENMNAKTSMAAAALAVAAVAPPAMTQADFVQQEIDDGTLVVGLAKAGWIETREYATGDSAGNKTWYFSTIPPAGTIYRML